MHCLFFFFWMTTMVFNSRVVMSTFNNTRAYESVSFGVQQKAELELHLRCRCQSFDSLCVQRPID